MYTNDLQAGVAIFAGFITSAWASPCLSITISAPVPYSPVATKASILKGAMGNTTNVALLNCSATAGNKWKYIGGATATWYPMISLANPLAYTASKVVSGGTMAIASSGTATKLRFWFDSYTAGGLKKSTAGPVTTLDALGSAAGLHVLTGAFTAAQSVTVPVGGFLVARIDAMGVTARLYMNTTPPVAPVGATRTFAWNPTEVAGSVGSPVENREQFFDSQGNTLPDGVKVYEYDAKTMQSTGNVGRIGHVTGVASSTGAVSLFVAGTTGFTAVTIDATSENTSLANGAYTFSVVANLLNFDLTVVKDLGTPQTFASVNLAAAGLQLYDGGLQFTVAGVAAVGSGSFSVTTAGKSDVTINSAAVASGEVVFTRAAGDVGEYFYVIPDTANGQPWLPSRTYAIGAKINPQNRSTLIAEVSAVTTGITALTAPAFPATKGATVVDGGVTWVMTQVETICTNALKGYQIARWNAGSQAYIAAVGPPAVAASKVAPAGVGHNALCTSVASNIGVARNFVAGLTGFTSAAVSLTNVASATANGSYSFSVVANLANVDLVVIKGAAGVPQTFPSVNITSIGLTLLDGGLKFDITGTPVVGAGGSFSVGASGVGVTDATAPVWATTVVDGVTTIVDGGVTWTMFNDIAYT